MMMMMIMPVMRVIFHIRCEERMRCFGLRNCFVSKSLCRFASSTHRVHLRVMVTFSSTNLSPSICPQCFNLEACAVCTASLPRHLVEEMIQEIMK
jgi:hypothetical protein